MSLVLLFHYLLLSMFRMLVHPSSGTCDLLWIYFMCCIALVRCVLVLRCGSAGWCRILIQVEALVCGSPSRCDTLQPLHHARDLCLNELSVMYIAITDAVEVRLRRNTEMFLRTFSTRGEANVRSAK